VSFAPPARARCATFDRLGALRRGLLAVHCVQADRSSAAYWPSGACGSCSARAATRAGVGLPPVEELLEAGVEACLGSDSLASAPTLDVLDDLRLLRREFPALAVHCLVEMATRNGAQALGFDEPGHGSSPGSGRRWPSCRPRARSDDAWPTWPTPDVPARAVEVVMLQRALTFGRMIKFPPPIFALPFCPDQPLLASSSGLPLAAAGWVLCHGGRAQRGHGFTAWPTTSSTPANPRTAVRELPRGVLTRGRCGAFVLLSAAALVLAAGMLTACASTSRPWRCRSSSALVHEALTHSRTCAGAVARIAPVGLAG